jgi:hypothetical protein
VGGDVVKRIGPAAFQLSDECVAKRRPDGDWRLYERRGANAFEYHWVLVAVYSTLTECEEHASPGSTLLAR